MNDVNSLSHTSWNCKYHVVFAPKYRRREFFGEKRREIGSILRTLCNWEGIKIRNTGTGNSGAVGTMWTRQEKMQRRYRSTSNDNTSRTKQESN